MFNGVYFSYLDVEIETVFCDQANYCRYGARCSIRNTTDNYRGDAAAGPAVMSHHQGRGGSVCSCDHIRCQKFSSYQPLCGDDGVTYENECFLKKSACVEQSPKTKLHNGPCKVFDRGSFSSRFIIFRSTFSVFFAVDVFEVKFFSSFIISGHQIK